MLGAGINGVAVAVSSGKELFLEYSCDDGPSIVAAISRSLRRQLPQRSSAARDRDWLRSGGVFLLRQYGS